MVITMAAAAGVANLLIPRCHLSFRGFGSGERSRKSSSMAASIGEKIPLLMVSCSSASSPEARCLYKLTKDDTYHITNLEKQHHELSFPTISTHDYCLVGSSRGFFFFRPRSGGDILAFDPVTGAQFRLPPVPSTGTGPYRSDKRIKIVLSPSLDTAFLIRDAARPDRAAFTHLPSSPSSQWIPFFSTNDIIRASDCILHKNRLYVTEADDIVVAFDENAFSDYHPSSDILPSMTWSVDKSLRRGDLILCSYLVEGPDGSDIFLLSRCRRFVSGFKKKTMRFFVHKLDDNGRDWRAVKSIGDLAFFVGHHGTMCLPINRGYSSVLEPDCVYFTDELCTHVPPKEFLYDTGIYHLEDGTVEFLEVTDTGMIIDYSMPLWLPPY